MTVSDTELGRTELGRLLRHHREALAPAEAGLPAGPRRRTPGLRRAELATLAGVSIEYLTRLEQGRDRHPSPQVLTALASALRLSPHDRELLFRTAKATGGAFCALAHPAGSQSVRPTVRALLDRLEPAPAVLLGPLTDLLAWTGTYHRLAAPVGLLPEGTDEATGSLLRYVFTDARAHATFPDWEEVADEQVARLRTRTSFGDHQAIALAEELTAAAGAAFAGRYQAPARLPANAGLERWCHPDLGELRLAYETLLVPGDEDQRLVVYLAADEPTGTLLEKLAST